MGEPLVIHVNEQDEELGTIPKLEAHQRGILHRAISVFIMNSEGEWLMQKRAGNKYHSAGLWSNSCCSHPYPNESTKNAAHRRLMEEMGMDCELHHMFSFIYKAELDGGLTEHELDHVFIGYSDDLPNPDDGEVSDWKHISEEELEADLVENPNKYTVWFKLLFPKIRWSLTLKETSSN